MGNSTRIICSLDYITDDIYDHFFQQIHVSTAVYRRVLLILSLSNDDGNGSKNVTQKVYARCFKLHRSYLNSIKLSNVSDFSGVEY